jgi:GT2 family glycosyltransferase
MLPPGSAAILAAAGAGETPALPGKGRKKDRNGVYFCKLRIAAMLHHGRLAAYYRRLRSYYRRWRQPGARFMWLRNFLGRDPYTQWVREEERFCQAVREGRIPLVRYERQPTIGIVVDVQAPVLAWLHETVTSVLSQWYPHWELWLCVTEADAALSTMPWAQWRQDERIRVVTRMNMEEVSVTWNALLHQTSCEFVGVLGQHDALAHYAFHEIARRLQQEEVDVFYSDEDSLDANGRRSRPFFKPDWSPDLCLSSLYACRFGVYRRQLVQEVGGFRSQYAACPEYDLLLRCTEQSERISHIPRVLYHARVGVSGAALPLGEKPEEKAQVATHQIAKRALQDAIERRGEAASVEDGPVPGVFRVRRRIHRSLGEPLISIIIPTRDQLEILRSCIESIERRTTYRNYEILVVDNRSQEPHTRAYLASLPHRVLGFDEPFNFARLNNIAVAEARGEYVLLLNNDMEVLSPDWLTAMLEQAQRKEVGAVGAQLLYPDATIQHAGVILGLLRIAGHAHKYLPSAESGYFSFPHVIRNYSAVTAACLLTCKAVYEEIGGMDERLAVTFNDVDFCLRLRAKGYLITYTPYARLYHDESRSRWRQSPPEEEARFMLEHWGKLLSQDPYYNPHLTLKREDFRFDLRRARAVLAG